MNRVKRGFTLIELLIVVLIIGILAAIAVPQYQKAVLKSRFSSLIPLGKTLNESNEVYYMEHGNYSDSLGSLDVTTQDNNVQVTLGNENQHQYVLLTRDDIKNQLRMYQKHSPDFAGETHCEALIDNTHANWLCEDALKGTLVGNKYGYAVYSLNDSTVGTLARIYYASLKKGSSIEDGDICIGNGSYSCYNINVSGASKCIGAGGYDCSGRSTFSEDSVCMGQGRGNCSGGTFDHSYCVANYRSGGDSACREGTFNNHSVCYANKLYTCTGTYDESSCCVGGSNCPDGTRCEEKEGIDMSTIPEQPTYP